MRGSLPFGERTAQILMKISRDERLRKANHDSLLPNSWMTLYELTKLEDSEFEQMVSDRIGLFIAICSGGILKSTTVNRRFIHGLDCCYFRVTPARRGQTKLQILPTTSIMSQK